MYKVFSYLQIHGAGIVCQGNTICPSQTVRQAKIVATPKREKTTNSVLIIEKMKFLGGVFLSIYIYFNILQHPVGTFGKAVPYPAHGNQGLWKILRGEGKEK